MRRELTYAGKPLSEFGVWVDNSKIYRKPMKRYTGYDIPARNGTLYQSDNKYDNVTMEFNCYIKKDFDTNFSNLVNYLNSFDTYQKLENSHNPNMFRLALFHEAVEVETGQFLKDGQFRLYFDCKPQEFYKSGESYQPIQRSSSTATGNPVTVENPSGLTALTGLSVDIQPVQSGSGDPSPTNVRPITGHTSAKVTRTADGSSTNYTIDLNGTSYGGTLDVVTGVLTVDKAYKLFDGSEAWSIHGSIASWFYIDNQLSGTYTNGAEKNFAISNMYVQDTYNGAAVIANGAFIIGDSGANKRLVVKETSCATVSAWTAFLSSHNLQICYKLATPQTVQLTPQQVSLLTGTNIISTDTENIEVTISEPFTLENPSYMKAKPVFKVKIPSKVFLDGEQIIDAFGMIDWAETPSMSGDISYQVHYGYIHVQGQQSTDFERYIAYLTVPVGTYTIKLEGHDYRSLVKLKIGDNYVNINEGYTFTVTEKTTFTLSVFIQSYTQVDDDFTLSLDGQSEYMFIDSELMDAYYEDGTNANPYVELTDGYIELPSGETYITVEGEAEIMPNWWRL